MDGIFTAEFFIENRTRLRAQVSSGSTIVITGNGHMQKAADEPFKFVQDSNFWYLTGLQASELILVMTPSETYLIAPVLSKERQTFDGALDLEKLRLRSGIKDIESERTGWQRLKSNLKINHKAAVLAPNTIYLKRHRMHSAPYRRRLLEKLRRLDPLISLEDIRPILAAARCVKQPAELYALKKAINITCETLVEVSKSAAFARSLYEYEIEAAISYGFRSRGADGHAFEPIVGAGVHSTTLHHVDNQGTISPGELIVLDVGASVEHYAADITRTVSQTTFNSRQRTVFDAVAQIQDYAFGLLKPGVLLHEYELDVAMYTSKHLIALGLITSGDERSVRAFFPHATSHFLGLDTHDVGNYEQPLTEGMVLTCEPGIYIPDERIGIRIEDDVLITDNGAKMLSAACPRYLS